MSESLNLEAVIGFEGKVTDGMQYVSRDDGEYLIYAMGSTVVVKNIADNTQSFMQGHSNEVCCLAVSNDGKKVVSGQNNLKQRGSTADAIIWDLDAVIAAANGEDSPEELQHRLQLHKGKVEAVAFSACGQFISSVGGQDDNSLVVWDAETGIAICGTPAHTDSTHAVQWYNTTSTRLVTCGRSHLKVWKFDRSKRKLFGSKAKMGNIDRQHSCIAIPADDSCIYTGTTSGEVMEISNHESEGVELEPRFLKKSKLLFGCGVVCLRTIENADRSYDCIVGDGTGTVTRIRSWATKKQGRNPFQTVMGGVTSLAIRGDDTSMCFVGTRDSNTYVINTSLTVEPELRGTCHSSPINDCCFPMGCSQLFMTCSANDIRIWNTDSRQELLRVQVPNLVCNCIHISPNGGTIVSGWDDGKIRGFMPVSGALKFVIQDAHSESCTAIKCCNEDDSYDGWKLVSGGQDGRVRIWEMMNGKQKMLASLKEHRDAISSLQVTQDNDRCISSSLDGSVIIWSLVTLTRVHAMFANTNFHDVKLHPDESQLLSCGTDRKITYWDASDAEAIRVLQGSDQGPAGGCVNSIDISTHDEGMSFVSGSVDRLVKVWHYDQGDAKFVGEGHSGDISAVRVSPDGQKIVSIGAEGAIFVWTMPEMQDDDDYGSDEDQ